MLQILQNPHPHCLLFPHTRTGTHAHTHTHTYTGLTNVPHHTEHYSSLKAWGVKCIFRGRNGSVHSLSMQIGIQASEPWRAHCQWQSLIISGALICTRSFFSHSFHFCESCNAGEMVGVLSLDFFACNVVLAWAAPQLTLVQKILIWWSCRATTALWRWGVLFSKTNCTLGKYTFWNIHYSHGAASTKDPPDSGTDSW